MKPICLLFFVALPALAGVSLVQPVLESGDTGDFASAKASGSVLSVTLTDSGAAKLGEYSRNHLGEKLTLELDGKKLASPVIRAPLGKTFQVDALSAPDAESVANAINRHR